MQFLNHSCFTPYNIKCPSSFNPTANVLEINLKQGIGLAKGKFYYYTVDNNGDHYSTYYNLLSNQNHYLEEKGQKSV